MKHVPSLRLLLAFAPVLAAPVVLAADKPGQKPELDPKADDVLRRLGEHMSGLDSFRCKASMDWFATGDDWRGQKGLQYNIVLDRPNRFALSQKGTKNGKVGATVVSDGVDLFAYLPEREAYSLEKPDAALQQASAAMALAAHVTSMPAIDAVNDLIRSDPYKAIMTGVTKLEYVGEERVDRFNCDHVKLTQEGLAREYWIRQGDEPVVVRFESEVPSDDTRIGDKMYSFKGGEKFYVRAAFKRWKLNIKARDRDFRYSVPKKDVQKTETVAGLAEVYPPHPLLGKEAPRIKVDMVSGGKFDLSKHKGSDIVVLDFWATWCGPCAMAMPVLIEVTNEYKDRGVRFVAVNQREQVLQIKAFLESRKFDVTVALDKTGAVSQNYYVSGIPQTVIIGKDGTVQAVHQGFSQDMKERLKEELETLLSGKSLVKS